MLASTHLEREASRVAAPKLASAATMVTAM